MQLIYKKAHLQSDELFACQKENSYLNLIEPACYADLFIEHPPVDFQAGYLPSRLPFFTTRFNLLTTLEQDLVKKLKGWPGFKYFSRLLNLPAAFLGTTITEYLPLPSRLESQELLAAVKNNLTSKYSLTIWKDLPLKAPFLDAKSNSCSEKLAAEASKAGFFEVAGQALAYVPLDFASLEEYLGRLSKSRRKDLKRKLKAQEELEVAVVHCGDSSLLAENTLNEFYEMYLEVFEQSEIHFDLMSKDYFRALLSEPNLGGFVVTYKHQGILAGYNICLLQNGILIDKYIGFKYPLARELNLYFVSWLYNLQIALDYGCKYYVAGWTDPEVKASLGAKFTFTRHLVWVKNPLLRHLLRPFRHLFEADRKTVEKL